MRRFTLAVLALGCLALGLATFTGSNASLISVPVAAQTQTCGSPCSIEPGATDKEGHFAFCHVDHGGGGHVICPDQSSIDQHFANHDTDFCITTAADIKTCLSL